MTPSSTKYMASCGDNFPIVRIACFFIGGVLFASACTCSIGNILLWGVWLVLLISYISIVLCLPPSQFYKWRSYVGILGLSAIFWAGLLCRMQYGSNVNDSLSVHIPHMEAYVAVALESLPSHSTKKILKVAVQQVYTHNSWHKVPTSKVQLQIKNDLEESIQYGNIYVILGCPHQTKGPLNPYTFNYQTFLQQDSIYYQQYVSADILQKIGYRPSSILQAFFYQLGACCQNALTKHIQNPQVKAIVLALLLGIRDELDLSLRDAYAATGTMHILAVSGLHIGILYGILYFFMYWRKKSIANQWIRDMLICVAIWIYAGITGLSSSVLRAACMFSLVGFARLIGKKSHVYNVLATSAILLLLYQPLLLESVSFQLSYLAVWGIIYLQPKIYHWLRFKNFILQRLWVWTSISLAAQIATAPISIYYFHQFPVYFIVANWVVVPAAFLIFSLGIAVIVTSHWGVVNDYISWLLEYVTMLMNKWVNFIHQLPCKQVNIYIDSWQVILCYGILVSCLIFLHTRTFKAFILVAIVTLTLAIGSIKIVIQQYFQRGIIFYSVAPYEAIAFVHGMHGLLLLDQGMSENKKKVSYQLHPILLARGIDCYQTCLFDELECMPNMPWQTYDGITLGVWQGKKIIIINHDLHKYPVGNQKIFADFLVIQNNSVNSLSQILDRFDFNTLVIGSSNWKKLARKIENEANNHQVNNHNLEKGALQITW